MNYTEQDFAKKIPADELLRIQHETQVESFNIFSHGNEPFFPKGACSHCDRHGKWSLNQPVIVDILTRESWCVVCWAKHVERRKCIEYLERKRVPLDVKDFARI